MRELSPKVPSLFGTSMSVWPERRAEQDLLLRADKFRHVLRSLPLCMNHSGGYGKVGNLELAAGLCAPVCPIDWT